MDMEFGASCAEGLWVCSRAQRSTVLLPLWSPRALGQGSELHPTGNVAIVGGLCEPLELGSWPPVPPSACLCPFITTADHRNESSQAVAAKGAFNFSLGSWF